MSLIYLKTKLVITTELVLIDYQLWRNRWTSQTEIKSRGFPFWKWKLENIFVMLSTQSKFSCDQFEAPNSNNNRFTRSPSFVLPKKSLISSSFQTPCQPWLNSSIISWKENVILECLFSIAFLLSVFRCEMRNKGAKKIFTACKNILL